MNIYELSIGRIKHYIAATDEQDAYKQGTDPERFPDINYMPFEINEVTVPGFIITLELVEAPKNKGGRPKKVE